MTERIDIMPIMSSLGKFQHATSKGIWYSVCHDGKVLIEKTTEPFYNAARALHGLGKNGCFEMWAGGTLRMTGNIEKCANVAVIENGKTLRLGKWSPFVKFDEDGGQND